MFWVGSQGPSSGPGRLPHITYCKAPLDGAGVCVEIVPSGELLEGLAPSSFTSMALATAAAWTSEQNGFLSTL